ncbi:hypothetical protein GGF31_002749 [Allomyces arbusculus]|nr:hypothetical protein GGF31_002749 [Allomyces arbusculus]
MRRAVTLAVAVAIAALALATVVAPAARAQAVGTPVAGPGTAAPAPASPAPAASPAPTAAPRPASSAAPSPAPSSAASSAPPAASSSGAASTSPAPASTSPLPTGSTAVPSPRRSSVPNPTATGTDLSPTPTPTDPCALGVCDVGQGRGTCLLMEKTYSCQGFQGYHLPTDLRAYFDARFPLKKPEHIPILANSTTFDNLFGSASYSYLGLYINQYMLKAAACNVPNQRWYRTWICLDLLKFFHAKGDPCSAGAHPAVCGSTLDQRADSILTDVSNKTECGQLQGVEEIGMAHVDSVRHFEWRSPLAADSTCLSAAANEPDQSAMTCGYSEYAVCAKSSLCPSHQVSNCKAMLRAASSAAKSQLVTTTTDPNDRARTSVGLYLLASIGGLALLALFVALYSLSKVRTRSGAAAAAAHAAPTKPVTPGAVTTALRIPPPTVPAPATAAANHPLLAASVQPIAAMAPAALMAPPPANPPVMQAQVTALFNATRPDELSLVPGQWVSLLATYDDGWAQARVEPNGLVGFIPLACVGIGGNATGGRYASLGR